MTLNDFTKVDNVYVSNQTFTYSDDNISFNFKYVIYCHEYTESDFYEFYARYETYIAIDKDSVHQNHRDSNDIFYNDNYGTIYLIMFGLMIKSNIRKGKHGVFSKGEFNKIVKNLENLDISRICRKKINLEKLKAIVDGTTIYI